MTRQDAKEEREGYKMTNKNLYETKEDSEMKVYVLDTSALLAYPDLIFRLQDCEIVIPEAAVRELHGLRHSNHLLLAEAAEKVLKIPHSVGDRLSQGVELITGATLRSSSKYERIDDLASTADNRIVGAAISLRRKTGAEVTVLSADTNMRNVARAYGLTAELPCFQDAGTAMALTGRG
jgi:PhoH-like ATPase